jgi:hypothetical protein
MTAPLEPTLPMTERELASLLAEAHLEGQRAALAAPPNQEWLDKAVELVHALGDADTRDDAYEALLSHLKTAQAAPIVEPAEAFDLEAKALATPVQAPGWRYGSEVMKIMEAAWTGDTKKAAAYVGLMADKMDADGHAGAKWLRQHLEVLEGKREPVYVHAATPVQAAPIEPEPVAKELRDVLRELLEALRREAPGTPLNNHRFDALGAKAYAAIAKYDAAMKGGTSEQAE